MATSKPSTISEEPKETPGALFPIIGVGASAGGLEALEQLLQRTTADCGIAYVIIQHLVRAQRGKEVLGQEPPKKGRELIPD